MTEPLDGDAGVRAWIDGVKPAHRGMVARIDALIGAVIPKVRRAIKWRKPTQPLGVPVYGLPGKGWMVLMWSFKNHVSVGFVAGTLLEPPPPVDKMASPWSRTLPFRGRRADYPDASAFDEAQLRSWLEQARDLPGWGPGSAELQ